MGCFMIDHSQSSSESRKRTCDKNQAPGDHNGLRAAIQKPGTHGEAHETGTAVDKDPNLRGEGAFEFLSELGIFALGALVGFGFGIIFGAILWHI
jgi:hypothetical protein